MTWRFTPLAVFLALTFVSATVAPAQEQGDAPGADAIVPLSVEVTISRYRGDELVGSLPYMLSVTAGSGPSTLRFDDRVPVPVGPPIAGLDGVSQPRSFNYEEVGTLIECVARTLGGGRYEVTVGIAERSIDGDDRTPADAAAAYASVFRSFRSDNTLVLRDGQSRQYAAAADRLGGETIRVDVTLTVLE